MIACVFLTRKCPRNCGYCATKFSVNELTTKQWKEALRIVEDMGINFYLAIGNDPWVLGEDLLDIVTSNGMSYGMYTSAYPKVFYEYAPLFFKNGLNQLSVGIDYNFEEMILDKTKFTSEEQKAKDAWKIVKHTRQYYPEVDVQSTFTLNRQSWPYLIRTVRSLSEIGVITDVNMIHYDSDGGFDFFPPKKEMKHYILPTTKSWASTLENVFIGVLDIPNVKIFNPEYLNGSQIKVHDLLRYRYHCKGDPLGGPTIEADGSLRLCAYRKGTRVPKLSIFDLVTKKDVLKWKLAEIADAAECPGCSWGCSMFYKWRQNLTEAEQYEQFARR